MSSEIDILRIISQNPGITGEQIHARLVRASVVGRKWGEHSTMAAIFGPSFAMMYVKIARLERDGIVHSEWGVAALPGGSRPRRYWPGSGSRA